MASSDGTSALTGTWGTNTSPPTTPARARAREALRAIGQDALELIEVSYRPLPAVIDPVVAAGPAIPLLHPRLGRNVISDRSFHYGDPEAAFASAAHRITATTTYPRNSSSRSKRGF